MITRDEWFIKMRIVFGSLTEKELIKGFRYDYKNGLLEYTDKGNSVIINPVGKESYEITKEFFKELMDF
jgi:hypothetical protein